MAAPWCPNPGPRIPPGPAGPARPSTDLWPLRTRSPAHCPSSLECLRPPFLDGSAGGRVDVECMNKERVSMSTEAGTPAMTTRCDKVGDEHVRGSEDEDSAKHAPLTRRARGRAACTADFGGAPGSSKRMQQTVGIKLKIYTTESNRAKKTTVAHISRGIWSRGQVSSEVRDAF